MEEMTVSVSHCAHFPLAKLTGAVFVTSREPSMSWREINVILGDVGDLLRHAQAR